MALGNFLENEKEFAEASAAFLTVRILDVLSTYILFSTYGAFVIELNPLADFFMSRLGLSLGLAVVAVLTIPVVLCGAHVLNKKLSAYGTKMLWFFTGMGFTASFLNMVQAGFA